MIDGISPETLAALERAALPDFPRWQQMITATGGCAHPIRLVGRRLTFTNSLDVIDSYRTADEPTGYLLTACGNRRASRCPACSATYRDDTYHLILSGLRGGKGVPDDITAHPRVFATFTAPSFGPVHRRREAGGKTLPCRPRRDHPLCPHGRPLWCRVPHSADDSQVGQPLCGDCYDYFGAVLWNAHAGLLWRTFTRTLPVALAGLAGLSRAALRACLRPSFAKVAEYQARGLVHFHAVIRLDGPDGPTSPPPAWATTGLLADAIRIAAGAVQLPIDDPNPDDPPRLLRWGGQLDVAPVHLGAGLDGVSDQRVASYVAKYATKGAEASGTVDRPIRTLRDVAYLDVTEHARRMIYTCFLLGDLAAYRAVPLRRWAHMLGYGGHFSTKSRHYSTTLASLRHARAAYRAEQSGHRRTTHDPDSGTYITVQEWRFAGSGLRRGEAHWAEIARERIATARHIQRERLKNNRP
ncbi:replication initiator [Acrocarpospora catenulata]|uniref:replication initiator n=1 Tax=Acrocarpospora catenulata TaxID=2836182 RepID=UPI001BDA2F3B|nr:replication initiator [Acrocarpospora catenulata]